jgi:hypothetical protein
LRCPSRWQSEIIALHTHYLTCWNILLVSQLHSHIEQWFSPSSWRSCLSISFIKFL